MILSFQSHDHDGNPRVFVGMHRPVFTDIEEGAWQAILIPTAYSHTRDIRYQAWLDGRADKPLYRVDDPAGDNIPITPAQMRAFYAMARDLDELYGREDGVTKRVLKAEWDKESMRAFTAREAHDLLDEMNAQIESFNASVRRPE